MAKYVDLKVPDKEVTAYSYFTYIGPCALERPASMTTQVSNDEDDEDDHHGDDVGEGVKDGRCTVTTIIIVKK